MKVALVHYHLRTGGVTRVLENQSQALTRAGIDHLILSATDFSSSGLIPNLPVATVPALDYTPQTTLTASDLHQQLLTACSHHFGSPPDLWHIHNHSLGKNILFPGLIELLAQSRTPLILQPHDFAEDNRPSNYALLDSETIYPVAPHIHYAFINHRDQHLLIQAGLPPEQTHPLPNAVQLRHPNPQPSPTPPPGSRQNLVLYPVRGIRRKNLGEVLLLAALAPTNTRFAITLAPENPTWLPIHVQWKSFSQQLQLPVLFDVVDQIPPAPQTPSTYQSWREHASHILTTSIAEGFGLAFLEPAALHKPLLGRDLPDITADFIRQNITPGRLYKQIPIPLDLLDTSSLRSELETRLHHAYNAYRQPLTQATIHKAWSHLTAGDHIDFGNLPEPSQKTVIREALRHPHTFPLRDWLHHTLNQTTPTATPDQLEPYSLANSQNRLLSLYQTALASTPATPAWLPKSNVLHQYLHPHRFHFLRS